ncbi:hypothetical protein PLICRDRAFT_669145 [Plicaturopsis crispa FD-325 SS-3]|uniref:Uncharacterized protein n=1 Tax=Plicaturopsis crispa FD-325 SS-3 TaxID=944288 RepID=A0A0C9SRV3_PLICR|nr:hypothetical protein PLICRDRAFT_669145 [Plicaturopsis crispa FD-325 SS-3]
MLVDQDDCVLACQRSPVCQEHCISAGPRDRPAPCRLHDTFCLCIHGTIHATCVCARRSGPDKAPCALYLVVELSSCTRRVTLGLAILIFTTWTTRCLRPLHLALAVLSLRSLAHSMALSQYFGWVDPCRCNDMRCLLSLSHLQRPVALCIFFGASTKPPSPPVVYTVHFRLACVVYTLGPGHSGRDIDNSKHAAPCVVYVLQILSLPAQVHVQLYLPFYAQDGATILDHGKHKQQLRFIYS